MIYLIFILLIIILFLFDKMKYYKQKYKIYYNNYKQCLKVLSQYDVELKKYLIRQEQEKKENNK